MAIKFDINRFLDSLDPTAKAQREADLELTKAQASRERAQASHELAKAMALIATLPTGAAIVHSAPTSSALDGHVHAMSSEEAQALSPPNQESIRAPLIAPHEERELAAASEIEAALRAGKS